MSPKSSVNYKFYLFVFLLYLFRLVYCYLGYLKNYQWLDNGDESHIYLLGLKFFTSHNFPCWGPDIVYTSSYLPGGMQGVLVGLPFFVWPHPFAPYLFLFVILSVALIYLSAYATRLFPELPKWFVYALIALSPFSIHTGLKIINPAYVLCFGIPFFLSFIEVLGIFKTSYIHPKWRFFWMGLGVTAVLQLHASWIVLLLLLIFAGAFTLYTSKNKRENISLALFGIIGLVSGALTLLPTLYQFGLASVFVQGKNAFFDISHLTDIPAVIYWFLMVGGYDMNSFFGSYQLTAFVESRSYLSAFLTALLQISGILFVLFQLVALSFRKWRIFMKENRRFLFLLLIINIALICMYLFSRVRPSAHAIIILFPLSILYFLWFLRNVFLTTKIKPVHFIAFFSIVTLYYIIVIDRTDHLPSLGFREKAFEAISNGDASIFEISRFPYPAPKH
jgi:hypothetical protein